VPHGSSRAVFLLPPQCAGAERDLDKLTEEERAFVGVWTSHRSTDWHKPETDPEISDKLMDVPDGQRLEFLG
jgi:hypothetical protein